MKPVLVAIQDSVTESPRSLILLRIFEVELRIFGESLKSGLHRWYSRVPEVMRQCPFYIKLLSKRWLKIPTFGVKRALSHDFRYPICIVQAICNLVVHASPE